MQNKTERAALHHHPRWFRAVVAIQAALIGCAGVAYLGDRPAAAEPRGVGRGNSLQDRDGVNGGEVVPFNAVAQRRDQIVLLTRIADSLDQTNARLEAIDKRLADNAAGRVGPPAPGQ